MWAMGLIFLMAMFFTVGLAIGIVWFLVGPKKKRSLWTALLFLPVGCATVPVIGLLALGMVMATLQKSDLQLYQEIFGEGSTVAEQSMLFDDFGRGRTREIYMRIYPDGRESEFLLNLPGSTVSEMTLQAFINRGDRHGFMWWPSSDPDSHNYCETARILEADGFRGWRELRMAECLDAGENFPASTNRGVIYVIAWHREE